VEWVRFNNLPPPLTLRVNRLRTTPATLREQLAEHGVRTTPTRFAHDGLTVAEGNPYRTPAAKKGLFLAQDEASQLIAELVGARPGHRVLDTCAAPGGKTTALRAAIGPSGRLVAGDLRPTRLRVLRDTLDALGAVVSIVQLDLRRGVPCEPVFDRVLVDAPCSGLGTIRRDPDIRWRRQPADLTHFAHEQQVMLRQAARVVRPGGRLIYATCSSEPEENQAVVHAFLNEHMRFRVVARDEQHTLSSGLAPVLDTNGCLVTKPAQHGLEAFFAAVLERDQETRAS
ncbi:MAG: RsmB/NOP family class I SAM-dependent RNA methyltransferase, partial [Acidobacteriota bacterium]|nr:RsmB/NOP family class I SAM-dependent RNA methyltransferase [Acidobacteriota bacterium]